MDTNERRLSALVAQGWEIVSYSRGHAPNSGVPAENILLRRERQHKILSLRRKTFGGGFTVKEYL